MARASSFFTCQQCGYQSPKYLGRCPQCDSWGTMVEEITAAPVPASRRGRAVSMPDIIDLKALEAVSYERISTEIGEFDRCLGGGIVKGSLVLISGDPGIGKSTLLSQLSLTVNDKPGHKVLYIAGEESAQQIKLRINRIKKDAQLLVINEIDIDNIVASIEQVKPTLVIVDSIQTLETKDLQSVAGSVGQVRECAHRLQRVAKGLQIPIFVVGHVTKEGTVAGPRTLEHLVDVVLSLEGEAGSNFRFLRAAKNRFGPTDEVGIFDMEENGLVEVKNPSKLFIDQKVNAPGSAVVCVINGIRPMLLEIQALVTKSNLAIPRRISSGIDNNRLQLLVAVLSKRLGLPFYDNDVFVNVTGGIKITEPAADLAICIALVSSLKDVPVKSKTAFFGEVGLLGELRTVRNVDKRKSEAKQLGFDNVICTENAKDLKVAVKMSLALQ